MLDYLQQSIRLVNHTVPQSLLQNIKHKDKAAFKEASYLP